jgi:hypothetical protein
MSLFTALLFRDLSESRAKADKPVLSPFLLDLWLEKRFEKDCTTLVNGPFRHGMHAAQMAMYCSEKAQTRSGTRSQVGSVVEAHWVMPMSLMMPLMDARIPSPIMKVSTTFSKKEHRTWTMKVMGRSEKRASLTMKTTRLVRPLFALARSWVGERRHRFVAKHSDSFVL